MSDADCPSVSVVAPVYRNAATLPDLARRVRDVMRSSSTIYELIFVNDGSPDESGVVIARLMAQDPAVTTVELSHNIGQQRAVCVGLRRSRGASVVILDADLQDPPEAIPALLAMQRGGCDAVFAGRSNRYQSWDRMLTSRLYKRLQSVICGVPPNAGIFMALSRRGVDRIVSLERCAGLSVVAMVGLSGLRSIAVPVPRAERPIGTSSYSSWDRWVCGTRQLARAAYWRWRHGARADGPGPRQRAKHRMSAGRPVTARTSKLSSRWRHTSG